MSTHHLRGFPFVDFCENKILALLTPCEGFLRNANDFLRIAKQPKFLRKDFTVYERNDGVMNKLIARFDESARRIRTESTDAVV